jgi:two-component system, chemotaxis family, chemotaxis protein CheY
VRPSVILIVEDDPDCLESLSEALRCGDYDVATARNGFEAMHYLETTNAPDLILVDLGLPVMDGWQLVREQQRRPTLAKIPVVLVSADPDVAERAAALAAAGYLRKPLDIDALLSVVGRALGP